jgi:deoxyribose-phosphate aldolase
MVPAASLPDRVVQARRALACLDLTALNDVDTEADMAQLCQRAQGPHGPVAAVCVWPRRVAQARAALPAPIAVAAVANFPHGGLDVAAVQAEIGQARDAGATEIDLVLPWRAWLAGDAAGAAAVLAAARQASAGLWLKVILETGALGTADALQQASRLALDHGADCLKTSTGKGPPGASPGAAQALMAAIEAHPLGRGRAGFKASGGVRSVADAAVYLALADAWLGPAAVAGGRLRLGASALLDDIEATLAGAA